MRVLYHLPILPPKMPSGEALSQEIQVLQRHNDGELVYVNPNQDSPVYVPRLLFGLSRLKTLRAREQDFALHHFYNPDPFPYPYLLYLQRPVVYTVSSGISAKRIPAPYLNRLGAVTVYDDRSLQRLIQAGVRNAHLIHPGIDTARFTCTPLPLEDEVRLLVASAPWSRAQFCTKGIDALLAAAQQDSRLRLTFLWRGILAEEMQKRIHRDGLESRITLINAFVDVNQILASVHATITLAADPALIKAYPHSLLDSLAAGKPVLVNRAIPMADYVERTECGIVMEKVTATEVLTAVTKLMSQYNALQQSARQVGQWDFTLDKIITSFQQVYQSAIHKQ
ncbi:MAG: glycosyltransferase [Anaerolineae bacterium]